MHHKARRDLSHGPPPGWCSVVIKLLFLIVSATVVGETDSENQSCSLTEENLCRW